MAPPTAFLAPAALGSSPFVPRLRTVATSTCKAAGGSPLAPCMAVRASEAAARLAAVAAAATVLAAVTCAAPPAGHALTAADIRSLTYEQVKGTGLANRCPEVDVAKGTIPLVSGKSYRLVDLCLEPKTFQVEEEVGGGKKGQARRAFVDTKLMTRATYTLTGIEGALRSEKDKLVFEEEGGIDYAATTVQLPGGERLPFLFTIKALVATAQGGGSISTATEFGGTYRVPSYRTGGFLDPVRLRVQGAKCFGDQKVVGRGVRSMGVGLRLQGFLAFPMGIPRPWGMGRHYPQLA